MTSDHPFRACAALLACVLLLPTGFIQVRAQEPAIVLTPHRAIYDLSLAETRGNSQIAAVRGRILYDFDGNACQGYSLEFRQVSELDNGEGKVSTSDLRSTTWESANAKSFNFKSESFIAQNLTESVEGRAERGPDKTVVELTKPQHKTLDLNAAVVFPTEHMVRAIMAGRGGKRILDFPVYDGSESGEKVFDTLTVVGDKIGAGERKPEDVAGNEPKLAALARWPVTISYFSATKKPKSGEQTPDYAISFELYDNGISRALSLDYNDFVLAGKLTSLEIKPAKPCP